MKTEFERHELRDQHGGIDVSWSFLPDDLEIARAAFSLIFADDPRRAIPMKPVLRWSESFWSEFADELAECNFDRTSPGHLAALQCLIDQACEADARG